MRYSLVVMGLLLGGFCGTVFACGGGCGNCAYWNGERCVGYGGCFYGCDVCSHCGLGCDCEYSCVGWCSECTVTGCKSICDSAKCEKCTEDPAHYRCLKTSNCDPAKCESCVNGQCVVCNGDTSKCCNNGTCVPKCNPNGGSACTGDKPSAQCLVCPWKTEDDPTCSEEVYGCLCNWEEVSSKGNDASCAACASNCTVDEYCKEWKPVGCDDYWWWFLPPIMCQCVTTPSLYDPEYTGTHKKCP